MATGDEVGEVRASEAMHRPAFFELFFDLVFVVALITLARLLLSRLTWAGAAEVLILFLAFSLIWALTAWAADTFDQNRPQVQVQIIWVMVCSLVMAAAVPEAFGDRGLLFVAPYLAIHLGSGSFYLFTGQTPELRARSRRIFVWFSVSGCAWVAGAFLGPSLRGSLWAVAIALEYTAATLGWPIPGFGRSAPQEWRLVGERVSERYRQFLIIAFGVNIFVAGLAIGRGNYTSERIGAFGTVFAVTVLMWRIYIYRAGEMLTNAIASSTNPSRFSQFAAVAHLIMVLGVLVTTATAPFVIERPFGRTPGAWILAVLGGPALFLIGRGLLDYTVFSRVSWSRVVGLLVLGVAGPLIGGRPPLAVAAVPALVLLGVGLANLIAIELWPRGAAPPPVE